MPPAPIPGNMPVQTTTAPAFAGKKVAVPNKKKKQTNALLAALKGKK